MKSSHVLRFFLPATAFLFFLGSVAGCNNSDISQSQKPLTTETVATPKSETVIASSNPETKAVNVSLEPALNWQENNHVHGLAVNAENPQILYVATHHGLIQRSETGEWFWVGKQRADYMGFTADPTNSQRFYASGHPHSGGNLGFQVSENQGEDWQKISMPDVDFHALAIAPSNPNIFYGWAVSGAQGLFHSSDRGQTWHQLNPTGLDHAPFSLAVDPSQPNRIFATTEGGLYESTNSGKDWAVIPSTREAPVIGLTVVKEGEKTVIYGYRLSPSQPGLSRSTDNGQTWEPFGTGTNGTILYQAIAPSNPQIIYAVNEQNTIFQSQDGGKTWNQLS